MEIRLLGPIEVLDGDRTITFPRSKERALLAALALRPGEVISGARLLEALWGDDPPNTADRGLHAHISRVRKALGPSGAEIETHPGGYRLSEAVQVDAERAEQLLARARASENSETAYILLDEAAGLWRGPSLGDLALEPFAVGDAARLEELRAAILEARVDAQLNLGRHSTVLAELEALCAEYPLRESMWALRMLALYRSGRQPEALRAFQEVRERFVDELGLDPSDDLRALDAAIARRDPQLAFAPAAAQAGVGEDRRLPSGVVTFLLTDIEGSTAHWESNPQKMGPALARHDKTIAEVVSGHGGELLKTRGEGDSTFSVFESVSQAARAAIDMQTALAADASANRFGLRVRMSIHTGEAELRDGDYFGPSVNRAARLRAVAHGGQVLCSQASAQFLEDFRPDGVTLLGLGSHRLQDLARPEMVYQLCHPSLPGDFPPLQSLEALPNNLPVQLTSFVGREQEMAELTELLGANRLVTLTGAAGCGKTRLAVQLGAERLRDYTDGIWLVDLAPLGDPELLVQTVASSLGIRETPSPATPVADAQAPRTLAEILVDYLRSRTLLLVLDNCEHLLDAAASMADGLLRSCPSLRIVATSREPLGIPGEVTWRVRSLSIPQRPDLPRGLLLEYEAIRLFVDRARARVPSFELDEGDATAVAQICRRLDGIPLAIELAAARVEALGPKELSARLDDRFRVLTGGSRTGLERHQTLRAAVDWSYDVLSSPEQILLGRLSIFAGGCSLEAAEAVCVGGEVDGGDILDLLSRLVAKSLIVMDREASPDRYRMLETIRQYAREKLASDEAAELRKKHLEWCLELSAQAARGVWGAQQMLWFERLETEEDNLRQALEWTIGGGDAEHALALVGYLGRFWMVRRRVDEGLRWTLDALALDGSAFPYMRAQALVSAALTLVGYFGAYSQARDMALESLDIFRELGIRRGTFWALHTVSITGLFQGDIESAAAYGDEALEVARDTGHPGTLVYGLLNRADAAIAESNFELVDSLLAEALPMLRHLDDKIGLVRLLGIQGYVAIRAGKYLEAIPYLEETVLRSREIGDESAVVWALANLGCVALVTGDNATARRWFEEAQIAVIGGIAAPGTGGVAWPMAQVHGQALATSMSALRVHQGSHLGAGVGTRTESSFLDIFLLNGLAELALADGELTRSAELFGEALRRAYPLELAGSGDNSAVRASLGVTLSSAIRKELGLAEPKSGSSTWAWLSDPGLGPMGPVIADWGLVRYKNSGPRSMPVAEFRSGFDGVDPEGVAVPSVGVPGAAARPTGSEVDESQTAAGTGAPDNAPSGDRTMAGAAGAVWSPTSASVGDRVLMPSIVAGIAKLAVANGSPQLGARLFGAAEHLRGFTTVLQRKGRWILFEHLCDEMITRAREAIGNEAFDAAFADGQAMSGDAAIECAWNALSGFP